MKADQFHRIVETLHKHLNIDEPEFTVEAEPVTLTPKKADILKKLQVNRISLGVKPFQVISSNCATAWIMRKKC